MPMVSVIVPVYKVEKVLSYCIDSILKQDFSDFELILIDDGSPDRSGLICDQYAKKDSRIKVIHKDNGGVSRARNSGIDIAEGKYICFIDSDDYIDKNYLSFLIEAKKCNEEYDNIWCGFQTVDGYKADTKILQKVIYTNNEKITLSSVKEIMTLHEKWLDAGPCCKLYNKKIIVENNLYFLEDLSIGEDLIFNFNYLSYTNGKILVLNKTLYNYMVVNDLSLGSKYYSNMFEIYKKINGIMKFYLKKWNCGETQFFKFYNACFFKYEVVLKNTLRKDNNISYKEKIKYNNHILRSEEFRQAFNNMTYKPNFLYKLAYLSGNYRFVKFVDDFFEMVRLHL